MAKLEALYQDSYFMLFRSMRMRLALLFHTRPDLLTEVSRIAENMEDIFHFFSTIFLKQLNAVT